jgi:uncharacterized protein (UPF0216 family)
MGFGGSAAAMNDSLKRNRAMLKKRKSIAEIISERPRPNISSRKYRYKKASTEQLQNIRKRLQKENSKREKLKILAFLVVVATTAGVGYYFSLML